MEKERLEASLLGDRTPDDALARAGSQVPGSAHADYCSSRRFLPPLPVLVLPTILSSFRRARLPVLLPVVMAAAVAGMLRGVSYPRRVRGVRLRGAFWPMLSTRLPPLLLVLSPKF